jgi:acetyl-CoA carboxylase biotin carboxyl carrier protein
MKISKLKDLIRLVEESKITELEVSRFGTKVRISKKLVPSSDTDSTKPSIQVEIPGKTEETQVPEREFSAMKAPMVGTFYRAPVPDANPYVEIGDFVKQGQVVCIIEAMKVMNEIQSDVAGRVVKILADNESPVEYGQELFHLE